MKTPALVDGQQPLLVPEHITETFHLTTKHDRYWHVLATSKKNTWWTWRCSCGRDMAAETRAAFSHEGAAEEMAWWHRYEKEPWANTRPVLFRPGKTPTRQETTR